MTDLRTGNLAVILVALVKFAVHLAGDARDFDPFHRVDAPALNDPFASLEIGRRADVCKNQRSKHFIDDDWLIAAHIYGERLALGVDVYGAVFNRDVNALRRNGSISHARRITR